MAKLSADGRTLQASTFLGGALTESGGLSDIPAGLTLDAVGNIYVGGTTQSANFPVRNAYQGSKKNGSDGVVVKFNSSLSTLIWSTFLGGSQREHISDLKISVTGKVVVGGASVTMGSSNDFPVTTGAVNQTALGMNDGFVAVLSPAGNELLAATFLGTGQQDLVQFVEVDHLDNIYAAGFTQGSYPITAGTYGTPNAVGGYFIHKLNAALSKTEFSTHIGSQSGAGFNMPRVPTAFQVDNCNNIYLSGYPLANAPVTANALEKNPRSIYLIHLTDQAKTLAYASYVGGVSVTGNGNMHVHQANHSFITETGTLHHIECTTFKDYPVTANAYSSKTYNNGNDAAVLKFQFTPMPGLFLQALAETPAPSCGPYTVSFKNKSANAISYSWNFSDGSPESSDPNPRHTFQKPGTYKVRLIAANPAGCKVLDTTYVEVVVQSPPAPALQIQTLYLCQPQITLDAGNPGYSYLWSTGAISQSITVSQPGTYSVTTRLGDCQLTEQITVAATLPPVLAPNIFTPNHDGRNELFALGNLAPNTRLKIFNRWGKLVYESDNYQNDWDGRQEAAGTYYYSVESPAACAAQKGWVELAK